MSAANACVHNASARRLIWGAPATTLVILGQVRFVRYATGETQIRPRTSTTMRRRRKRPHGSFAADHQSPTSGTLLPRISWTLHSLWLLLVPIVDFLGCFYHVFLAKLSSDSSEVCTLYPPCFLAFVYHPARLTVLYLYLACRFSCFHPSWLSCHFILLLYLPWFALSPAL